MVGFIIGFIIGFTIIYLVGFFAAFMVHRGVYGYTRRLLKRLDRVSLDEGGYFNLKDGIIYYYYLNEDLEMDQLLYFSYTDDFLISRVKKIYLHNSFLIYLDPYYNYLLNRVQKHFKERKNKDILKLNIK